MATIKGTRKRDVLHGTGKADTVSGLQGNDDLYGAGGRDTLKGGAGNDKLLGGSGDDVLLGDAGNDRAKGGSGQDKLYGGAGNDVLFGETGNDTLDGGTGNDAMDGGAGDDLFLTGAGNDAFHGGDGIDTVDYSLASTSAVLHLDNTQPGFQAALGDTFFSVENVIGTNMNDIIHGTAAANVLYGGQSSDDLYGLAGADRLYGSAGPDYLHPGNDFDADLADGGDDIDTVTYFDSASGVVVDLELGQTGGGAVFDVLLSIENVIGSSHDDTLTVDNGGFATGGEGDDTLSGSTFFANGPFNYTMEHLSGGSGADKFLVHRNTGLDYIDDFIPGTIFGPAGDILVIKSSEFGGIQYEADGTGASTAIRNVAAGAPLAADRASAQFIFDMGSSFLYFDPDGTGSLSPEPVADLAIYHGALTHGGGILTVDEYVIV